MGLQLLHQESVESFLSQLASGGVLQQSLSDVSHVPAVGFQHQLASTSSQVKLLAAAFNRNF